MAINNRDMKTYYLPRLTALPRFCLYTLPTHVSQGFFLLQWSFLCCSRVCRTTQAVLQPPLSTHPPHSIPTTPMVQLSRKESSMLSLKSQILLHAPCTWDMVQNLLDHSFKGLILVGIYKSVSYFLSLLSSCPSRSRNELFSFNSPQSQCLEQCLACRVVPSRFSCVCATLWTAAQALWSMGFSRQKY